MLTNTSRIKVEQTKQISSNSSIDKNKKLLVKIFGFPVRKECTRHVGLDKKNNPFHGNASHGSPIDELFVKIFTPILKWLYSCLRAVITSEKHIQFSR